MEILLPFEVISGPSVMEGDPEGQSKAMEGGLYGEHVSVPLPIPIPTLQCLTCASGTDPVRGTNWVQKDSFSASGVTGSP